MREKIIEAMRSAYERDGLSMADTLDAALDVMMDPANYTRTMRDAAEQVDPFVYDVYASEFRAVIKAIKEGNDAASNR